VSYAVKEAAGQWPGGDEQMILRGTKILAREKTKGLCDNVLRAGD
jgi:hypothetical protein